MVPIDSEFYRECPEQKILKKPVRVFTKHAQVVNSLPIEPGVLSMDSEFYWECHEQKNVEKRVNNICKTRPGGQLFAKSRDLVITVKLAQFLTDRVRSGTN